MQDAGKEDYLRPSERIGLDWIGLYVGLGLGLGTRVRRADTAGHLEYRMQRIHRIQRIWRYLDAFRSYLQFLHLTMTAAASLFGAQCYIS